MSTRAEGVRPRPGRAAVLVILFFGLAAAAPAGDPETMTVEALLAELDRAEFELERRELRFSSEVNRASQDRINRFVSNKTDVFLEINDIRDRIQEREIALERIAEDARNENRRPFPEEVERSGRIRREIDRLKANVVSLEDRIGKISREQARIEDETRAAVRAIEEAWARDAAPLREKIARLEEIGRRRFPEHPLFQTHETTMPWRRGPPTVTGAGGTLKDADFLKALADALGPRGGRGFPSEFYCVGLRPFGEVPAVEGVPQITLFGDYMHAREHLERSHSGPDREIYRLETTQLVRTAEGREFLTRVRDALVANPDLESFRMGFESEYAYRRAVLERIQPPPPFLDPGKATVTGPPSEGSLAVAEPDVASQDGKIEKSLDRARRAEVARGSPEFEAVSRREWLVPPEQAAPRLQSDFEAQRAAALEDALRPADPAARETGSFAEEVRRALDAEARVHTPEVVRTCVEMGEATFAAQSPEVQKRISRGRFGVELWGKGMKLLEEGRAPWHSRSMTNLFLAVGAWDIFWIWVEQGFGAAGWEAGKFALVATALTCLARQGGKLLLVAETFGVGFTVLGLWDLWERGTALADSLVAAANRDLLLGDIPWIVRDPATGREVEVPLGFRSFAGSPAFGQPADRWHLAFRSREELCRAVLTYHCRLNAWAEDPARVPPTYHSRENLRLFLEVIGAEWLRKHREDYETLVREYEVLRSAQKAKEGELGRPFTPGRRPAPRAAILGAVIDPEIPSGTTKEVAVRAYVAVLALPGARLRLESRIDLKRDGRAAAGEEVRRDDLDLGISEAYRVFRIDRKLALSGPGDYEVAVTARLEPEGEAPPPKLLRFSILGRRAAGQYVLAEGYPKMDARRARLDYGNFPDVRRSDYMHQKMEFGPGGGFYQVRANWLDFSRELRVRESRMEVTLTVAPATLDPGQEFPFTIDVRYSGEWENQILRSTWSFGHAFVNVDPPGGTVEAGWFSPDRRVPGDSKTWRVTVPAEPFAGEQGPLPITLSVGWDGRDLVQYRYDWRGAGR